MAMATQTLYFLSLPFEIRNHIYDYSIPTKTIIDASQSRFHYTITKKETPRFDFDEPHAKKDARISSESQTAVDNLSVDRREGIHVPEVMDIGGCTDSEYEVDWDDVTIPLPGGTD
jgi:hypothetical protein